MRNFLDTEFNGFGGELISIALVPEDENIAPFYEAITCEKPTAWVVANAIPVLQVTQKTRSEVANLFSLYLTNDPDPLLVADWPEDIAHAANLLVTGPGRMKPIRTLRFELADPELFSAGSESETPHNALSDARHLRAQILAHERSFLGAKGGEGVRTT